MVLNSIKHSCSFIKQYINNLFCIAFSVARAQGEMICKLLITGVSTDGIQARSGLHNSNLTKTLFLFSQSVSGPLKGYICKLNRVSFVGNS